MSRGVTNHFIDRARERLGCDADHALHLGEGLLWAIRNERSDVARFVGRVSRDGRRVFQFRWAPTGKTWYAIIDTSRMTCITVLPAGFTVPREGKSTLRLKDTDI